MDMTEFMGDWITNEELEPTGSLAVILDTGVKEVGQFGSRPVFTLEFKKRQRKISLTKSSVRELVASFGIDSSSWSGKTVILVSETLDNGKKTIRVKPHAGPIPVFKPANEVQT